MVVIGSSKNGIQAKYDSGHSLSENIIRYTVIPMDICLTVDRQAFVVGEQFRPQLAVSGKCPIVFVESAPENGAAVLVEVLFGNNAVIKTLDIHHTDGIVCFSIDRDIISSDNIDRLLLQCPRDHIFCSV